MDGNGTVPTDNPVRPNLKPEDPRGSNLAPNDFTIVGAIDSNNEFDAATGESRPMKWG